MVGNLHPVFIHFNTIDFTISSLQKRNEMANKIKILLWVHRSKLNKNGLAPLILRLSYHNKKVEKATGFYVIPECWNIDKQKLKGNNQDTNKVNAWIQSTISKLSNIYRDDENNLNINLVSVIEKLFETSKDEPTLLNFFGEHNAQMKLRVNKGFAFSTYEKYIFTYDKVKAFIESTLNKKDIFLKDINVKFIMEFDQHLRVNDNNQHNTAVKYCINLKRVLNIAVLKGLLISNPCVGFKTVYKITPQVYLSQEEVDAIEKATLFKSGHNLVRDLFIFQCNTGLAYTDMSNLTYSDISTDKNGRKWIIKARQKSGIVSTIPLFPRSMKIIEKYCKERITGEILLLPSYSIQKYNQYINEVGMMAKLQKKLSSHVGRRTFGNIALSKGISLNVISKILGHSSTLITQKIYAITTQNIINSEIEKW